MSDITIRVPSRNGRWIVLALLLNLPLFAIGIYTLVTTKNLRIPISPLLPFLTALLPLLNLAGITHAASKFTSSSLARARARATLPIVFLLVIDIVLITLSGTHLESAGVGCAQSRKWVSMFKQKDGEGIKAIQDALHCCGYMSPVDKPFPFPVLGEDKKWKSDMCKEMTGATVGCAAGWAGAEKKGAGLMLGAVAVLAVIKLVTLVLLQRTETLEKMGGVIDPERRRIEDVGSEFGAGEDEARDLYHRAAVVPSQLAAGERTPLLVEQSPWEETAGQREAEREAAREAAREAERVRV